MAVIIMADIVFELTTFDYLVIAFHFSLVIGIGLVLSGKSTNSEEYFLAGRSMGWGLIGFSLVASQISTTSMIGLAGEAYATGISIYNYEWMAILLLIFFALFIIPPILRSQIYTMPEFLERRYSQGSRRYFAIVTLFLNIVIDTAGSLFAGALMLNLVFPDVPLWQSITVLALLAGLYTIVGGLRAVIITDIIQAVLLTAASVIIAWFAFDKVGGIDNILNSVPAEKLELGKPMSDPAMPWLGVFLGVPILGFYFWCTNQFMVQRILSAKNIQHARWASIFAGFLKLPTLFIMILPGSAAILLYPELERPDLVFPVLMFDLLPAGILGLVVAGFLAALMSQIDSTLNAASTIVTMDFVRPKHPDMSSEKLMKIGKLVTFVFMLLAVLWAPQIENFPSLFRYLQNVLAYVVPPVVVLFIGGIFWPRANAQGAKAAIAAGVSVAAILFVLVEILGTIHLHFLLVAPVILVVSATAFIVTTLRHAPPEHEQIAAIIWQKQDWQNDSDAIKAQPLWQNFRVQCLVLGSLTIATVVWFW